MCQKCIFIILIACVLGGCLSPWKGDEGVISIRIGGEDNGSANGRKLTNSDKTDSLYSLLKDCSFEIHLINGPGPNKTTKLHKYGDTASFSVAPGSWKIKVEAFTQNDQVNPVAKGSEKVDIIPGRNGDITIYMKRTETGTDTPEENPDPNTIMVINESDRVITGSLRWAIQTALGGNPGLAKTIVITNKVKNITLNTLDPTNLSNDTLLSGIINKSITITAEEAVTIKRGTYKYRLFGIGGGGTLILGGKDSAKITIDGGGSDDAEKAAASGPLIIVEHGQLIMNEGVTLQNNHINDETTWGGGVAVFNDGTFIMNGGTISGNKAAYGGGVGVVGGTFTMKDGEISGNNTSGYGGGVAVVGGTSETYHEFSASALSDDTSVEVVSTFTMNGGTISNNTADGNGGGVYVAGATFTMKDGGEISGNTAGKSGGGVYVGSLGKFFITNGIIYGEDDEDANKTLTTDGNPSYQQGKALYVASQSNAGLSGGSAQYGPDGNGEWEDLALDLSIDNTIEVVDGKLERPSQ